VTNVLSASASRAAGRPCPLSTTPVPLRYKHARPERHSFEPPHERLASVCRFVSLRSAFFLSSDTCFAATGHPHDHGPGGPNDLDWQHVQVSAALGKTSVMVAASVAFLGLGTLVTLLLVIFNRRVTLRHINASLAQLRGRLKNRGTAKAPAATQ
jgi:hypothetical protein